MRIHIAASDIAHKNGGDRHFSGGVVSPAYAWWSKRCGEIESTWPVIVDNGAWSDHTQERFPEWEEILARTLLTANLIPESRIKFMCLPDRVADTFETENMLDQTFLNGHFVIGEGTPFERTPSFPFAVVIQDGFDETKVDRYLRMARGINGVDPWIFIGGSTFEFKKAAITICKAFWPQYQIHLGKIHRLPELAHCLNAGVDSVDTSTFSRPPTKTYQRTLTDRLEQWEAYVNGDQTILTDWMDV